MFYTVNVVMQIWIYGPDIIVSFFLLSCADVTWDISLAAECGEGCQGRHRTAQEPEDGGTPCDG